MVFTAEHALDLMERETYRHYLMAYDRVWYHETAKRKQVASAFVEAVRTKHPDIYEDYDPTSFMLHDFLQPVFIDVLRDTHASSSEEPAERSRRAFQLRLLSYYVQRLQEVDIDSSRLDEFLAYCEENHSQWLDGFVPTEFHMGDIAGRMTSPRDGQAFCWTALADLFVNVETVTSLGPALLCRFTHYSVQGESIERSDQSCCDYS